MSKTNFENFFGSNKWQKRIFEAKYLSVIYLLFVYIYFQNVMI